MLMFRLLLCAFLVVALPSHAFAYLAKSESEAVERLAVYLQPVHADVSALQYNDAQQPTSPESSSHVKPTYSAIVNLNRWSISARTIDQTDGNDSSRLNELNGAAGRLPSLIIVPLYNVVHWQGKSNTSNFRISGWKDSNTLYVALNSQF